MGFSLTRKLLRHGGRFAGVRAGVRSCDTSTLAHCLCVSSQRLQRRLLCPVKRQRITPSTSASRWGGPQLVLGLCGFF